MGGFFLEIGSSWTKIVDVKSFFKLTLLQKI